MYRTLKGQLREFPPGLALILGGKSKITRCLPKGSRIKQTHYPQVDMMKTDFGDSSFDYIVSDQVLEHVENPFAAAEEQYRIVRCGGWVIATTCFYNPIHTDRYQQDFWRFTPDGLRQIFKGFSEVEVTSWGSMDVVSRDLYYKGRRSKYKEEDWRLVSSTENDPNMPWLVWVIARK